MTDPSYLTPARERWRNRTDSPLLVLAIGSLPLLLLESMRGDLTSADRLILTPRAPTPTPRGEHRIHGAPNPTRSGRCRLTQAAWEPGGWPSTPDRGRG